MNTGPRLLTHPTRRQRTARSARTDRAAPESVALMAPTATPTIAPQLLGLAVPIGSVTLHPRNPRRGDVAAVTESLRRFGQKKPIVVQASTG